MVEFDRTESPPLFIGQPPYFCGLSRPDRAGLHYDMLRDSFMLAENGFIPANVSNVAYGKCIGTVSPKLIASLIHVVLV